MAQFVVNPQRFDPYKNFKFRVKWDGRYVAGVSKISGLSRSTDVVMHREGGDPSTGRKSVGQTRFDPVNLERGVTHDMAFEEWSNLVWRYGAGQGVEVSLRDFRKDVVIELQNEAGQVVMIWILRRAWPAKFVALGPMDAQNGAVAFESLTLENEGWERDLAVAEPVEPTAASRRKR